MVCKKTSSSLSETLCKIVTEGESEKTITESIYGWIQSSLSSQRYSKVLNNFVLDVGGRVMKVFMNVCILKSKYNM